MDMQIFDEHIYELLSMYRSYKDKLSYLPKETEVEIINKEPISASALSDAYDALRTFCDQMDVDAIKMILDEMKIYMLPAKDEDIFDAISRKLLQFDWDGIEKLLQ